MRSRIWEAGNIRPQDKAEQSLEPAGRAPIWAEKPGVRYDTSLRIV